MRFKQNSERHTSPSAQTSVAEPEQIPVVAGNLEQEDVELIRGSIKTTTVAQVILAVAAAIGLIFLLKTVLTTILFSALLAFALDPLVVHLRRWRIPRSVGAVIALLLLSLAAGAITFFFYNRAVDFVEEVPRYSSTIRDVVKNVQKQAEKLEETSRAIMPEPKGKKPIPVQVQTAPPLARLISNGASQLTDIVLAVSFIPFLVYFMLTWKSHVHSATLHILPPEHRAAGYRTIGRISEMVRAFIVGNLIVGCVNAIASTVVFGAVGLPYFYFLGFISAFAGLIPYLGIFLALIAPIAVGMGTLTKTRLLIIFATVVVLHLLTMNVLYPKLIGKRLRLNPLAVALSLLFWAWIWGAPGLILAVPLIGVTKIVCDFVEPLRGLGDWLGT